MLRHRRSLAIFPKPEWIFAVFRRCQNLLATILVEIFVRDELEEEIGYVNYGWRRSELAVQLRRESESVLKSRMIETCEELK